MSITDLQNSTNELGVTIVYICSISSHEGRLDARAGFGIDWGPHSCLPKGGPALGAKTKLRAGLTAVLTVLETALTQNMTELCIRHQSEELEKELRAWGANKNSQNNIQQESCLNADVLGDISELTSRIKVVIERARPSALSLFKKSETLAKRVAGLHSTSFEPVTDKLYEGGIRIVDIHGECRERQLNPVAGYGVFWDYNDPRNRSGIVHGIQTTNHAYFTALYHAFEAAFFSNHDEIIIRTRSESIRLYIENKKAITLKHRCPELFRKLNDLRNRFSKVSFSHAERDHRICGQIEAEMMATLARSRGAHVSICGIGTSSSDRIARYGIFWGEGDERNRNGWIGGTHGQLCVERLALVIALKQAIEKDVIQLTVYTDSETLIPFLETWRKQWKQANWPPPSIRPVKCVENSKLLDTLLEKIKVQAKNGHDGFISGARHQAESVEGCSHVRTFGMIIQGNNEPIAKYGAHWKYQDEKNFVDVIKGEHSLEHVKRTALRRALEIAREHGITKLFVQTDLKARENTEEKMLEELEALKEQFEYIEFRMHDATDFYRLHED